MAGSPRIYYCKGCQVMSVRLSWSSLRSWRECKQRVKLQRAGKRSKVEDARGYLPGTISDRVVRDWLQNPDRKPGEMVSMIPGQLEKSVSEASRVKWKSEDDKQRVIQDCIEAVTTVEPQLMKYVVPFEHEEDFSFSVPMLAASAGGGDPIPVTLNGFMDILVKAGGDKYFIFDLKQTRNNDYWKKTAGQMVFYALAVELQYGVQPLGAALLQPLAKPTVKPIEVGTEAMQALAADITQMANDIVNDDMPVRKDTKECTFCNVKMSCPKFAGTGTGRVSLGDPLILD